MYLQTLRARRKVQGESHPRTVTTTMRLAAMYVKQQRYRDAEEQLLRFHAVVSAAGNGATSMSSIGLRSCADLSLLKVTSRQSLTPS